jgi:hypothetical protein
MAVDMKALAGSDAARRRLELSSLYRAQEDARYAYAQAMVAHAVAELRELFPGAASATIDVGHDGIDASVTVWTIGDPDLGLVLFDVEDDELGEREDELVEVQDWLAGAAEHGYDFFTPAGHDLAKLDLVEVR